MAKPEWWTDEGLKALSARVVRAAPDALGTHLLRAKVLGGGANCSWQVEPRSAAEFRKAATHYERAAALHPAPTLKAKCVALAELCRSQAEGM